MKIKNIEDIESENFGGKALGLSNLVKINSNVPKAFVLDQEIIDKIVLNDEMAINELKEYLKKFDVEKSFAVRSSASNEDGNQNSFAGMYESVLNVSNNTEDIIDAIKDVNNSKNSKKTEAYNNENTNMNIVIQEMINPKYAGVCFTNAIDLDGSDVVFVEYVDGLGDKLVSGKSIAKSLKYDIAKNEYKSNEEFDSIAFDNLFLGVKNIIEKTNDKLDIEWCIDFNDNAYFVQARPITRNILVRPDTLNGAIASPGICVGNIYIIDEDLTDDEVSNKIEMFPEGAILLSKTTDTNYVSAMKKASGIITTEGSILSHAAIIAREFNIPCITGFRNAFSLFEDGNHISIDTNKREIIYKNEKVAFGDGKEINELELYIFNNIIEEEIYGKTVLIEKTKNEFGIHIDEELNQEEIDKIDIYIRKKYKKAPIILQDQKFLWYFEFQRFMKIPGYTELVEYAHKSCENFDVDEVDNFVNKITNIMKDVNSVCKTKYEKVFSLELAQSLHFLINLYTCNGFVMKELSDISTYNGYDNLKDMLFSQNGSKYNAFFSKIEEVRANIWGEFVSNGWTDDDYFDYREESISKAIKYDQDDVIDCFYDNLKINEEIVNLIKIDAKSKKKL